MSIIYVWDEGWPGRQSFAPRHDRWGEHQFKIGFEVKRGDKTPSIVNQIVGLSQGKGQIKLLRLCAHGNVGRVQLGEGLTETTAKSFEPLKGYFASDPYAILEIHACAVAGSEPAAIFRQGGQIRCMYDALNTSGAGANLLKTLAAATGVPVKAGIRCQLTDVNYEFEGPTVTSIPGSPGLTFTDLGTIGGK